MAWFAWQCAQRGGKGVTRVIWAFAPHGFDHICCPWPPLLRATHLQRIQERVRARPRCNGCIVVLADGKHGACRFVRASAGCSVEHTDFGVQS
eukprot:6216758-Lingulodinium_polyedra.AAC.1